MDFAQWSWRPLYILALGRENYLSLEPLFVLIAIITSNRVITPTNCSHRVCYLDLQNIGGEYSRSRYCSFRYYSAIMELRRQRMHLTNCSAKGNIVLIFVVGGIEREMWIWLRTPEWVLCMICCCVEVVSSSSALLWFGRVVIVKDAL